MAAGNPPKDDNDIQNKYPQSPMFQYTKNSGKKIANNFKKGLGWVSKSVKRRNKSSVNNSSVTASFNQQTPNNAAQPQKKFKRFKRNKLISGPGAQNAAYGGISNKEFERILSEAQGRRIPATPRQLDMFSPAQLERYTMVTKNIPDLRPASFFQQHRLLQFVIIFVVIFFISFFFLGLAPHSVSSLLEPIMYVYVNPSLSFLNTNVVSLASNFGGLFHCPYGCSAAHVIQPASSTFQSFVTLTPSAQNIYLSSAGGVSGQEYYSVKNDGNVPLGSSTSNPLSINLSCGSSSTCKSLITFESPTTNSFIPLTSYLLPSTTITNGTSFNVACNPNIFTTSPLTVGVSFSANLSVDNYTAASISPLEFVSQSFDAQLLSSSSPLIPNQPSVTFVSPGPVQISVVPLEPLPIITSSSDIPLSVKLSNSGSGTYSTNLVSVFVPSSIWSSSAELAALNPSWTCAVSKQETRLNFVFPGSSFWNCTPSGNQVHPSMQFILPPVTSLGELHFNTVPILASVDYNYYQQTPIFFSVISEVSC